MTPTSTSPPARSVAFIAIALLCSLVRGQEAGKKERDKGPRVILASPLAVAPGTTTVLKLRGQGLAEASAVRSPGVDRPPTVDIKSKGKAETAQGLEAADAGDTQAEVELVVPRETQGRVLPLVVVTPAGESKPYELAVVPADSLTAEKEPNDGFRQAQAVAVSKVVTGTVQGGDDIDVFRFDARAGQNVVAEVAAARLGSALDSLLTLYDSSGHVIASNDDAAVTPGQSRDSAGATDSVLRFRCPADGTYYVALTDANARGGPAHPYLLSLKAEP